MRVIGFSTAAHKLVVQIGVKPTASSVSVKHSIVELLNYKLVGDEGFEPPAFTM